MSLDVNPASRQALEQLIADGHMAALVRAGARIHQTGCNGCVGMGQAPASGRCSPSRSSLQLFLQRRGAGDAMDCVLDIGRDVNYPACANRKAP